MHSSRGDHDEISIVNNKDISEKTTRNQPFTEVSDDILIVIFEKLEWIDLIHSKTVCKNWLQEITNIPYNHQGQFPWLLTYSVCDSKVKLRDECPKRSYIIEQSGQKHLLYDARVCASKFGWILMVSEESNKYKRSTLFRFFVYCPFNCKLLIKLPNFTCHLDVIRTNPPFEEYTFSSNPTLPDCVFFALFAYSQSQTIEIHTCRIRDKKWTYFKINLSIRYVRFSSECVNGLLYVVLLRKNDRDVDSEPILNSHVGTFDPQSQEWKLIKNEKGFMIKKSSSNRKTFDIESWKLFPVVYNNKELYLVRQRHGFHIFKYDMEEKQWLEQSSLGNRVLFIGDYRSSLLVDAVGKLSNMANNAFFGLQRSPYYPYSFTSAISDQYREFYVDSRKFRDADKFYQRVWIMPTI